MVAGASGLAIKGDARSLRALCRPALFGLPELDNVLADGGVTPGVAHVIEPLRREGDCDVGAASARRDQVAVAQFALGFLARSRRPALWIGPPRDLLCEPEACGAAAPEDGGVAGQQVQRIELDWARRPTFAPQWLREQQMLTAALDARRARRLAHPVQLARQWRRHGLTPVVLADDAASFADPLGAPTVFWRVGWDQGGAGDGGDVSVWLLELVREDRVRRVLTTPCDATGRLAPAPRAATPGKELMRRLARAL